MHTPYIDSLGVTLTEQGATITVWAPSAQEVTFQSTDRPTSLSLQKGKYGYWHGSSEHIEVGERYHFVVDGKKLPDPTSRAQPEGVHGPSEVVDLSFAWKDGMYTAPKLEDYVIYELHVGTFSTTHDFEGVIQKLDYLKDLGINAIEIMPVAQFPGERNWGYDGVFPFAVQHSYGGAKGLQKLVNACHLQDIAVILDVVYNHFGPEGNYLPAFGPYFTDKYHTPWGSAINFDDAWCNGVRDLVLENIRMWFRDFHIDALRLDAVHAIKDLGARHILQDIGIETDQWIEQNGTTHYLIAECDLNDPRFLDPVAQNGLGMHAQWVDEFHHALRVAVGEQRKGYYADFNGIKDLAKAFASAYVYDGNYSEHRQQFFGRSAEGFSGEQFVVFSQNHDQVGNRMLGERSIQLYGADKCRLMAFAVFVSRFTPMLFMGEEWGASQPFQYFVSHGDKELIEAVREGRKKEFADFHVGEETPDPQAKETFDRCVLDWQEKAPNNQMFHYYKALIALRKSNPVLHNAKREDLEVSFDTDKETILLTLHHSGETLYCILNFSDATQQVAIAKEASGQKIFDTSDPKWGGQSTSPASLGQQIPITPNSGVIYRKIAD